MLDVDRITDFDQLKQVTRLLHKENQRLHQKLIKLTRELATLRGESAQRRLALEIGQLQSQMEAVQRQLGKVSEKRKPVEREGGEDKPRQRGHGPRLQPRLQLDEQIHELPADERSCPACNGQLEEMGDQFEETEEITVVQRQFKLIHRRRRKYRCRCNGAVVTAPGPKGHLVRPGGRMVYATCTLLAEENDETVREFLGAHPTWSRVDPREGLGAAARFVGDALALNTSPDVDDLDGFFAVILRNEAGPV